MDFLCFANHLPNSYYKHTEKHHSVHAQIRGLLATRVQKKHYSAHVCIRGLRALLMGILERQHTKSKKTSREAQKNNPPKPKFHNHGGGGCGCWLWDFGFFFAFLDVFLLFVCWLFRMPTTRVEKSIIPYHRSVPILQCFGP